MDSTTLQTINLNEIHDNDQSKKLTTGIKVFGTNYYFTFSKQS